MKISHYRTDLTDPKYDEEHFLNIVFEEGDELNALELHDDGDCVFLHRTKGSFPEARQFSLETLIETLKTL